MEALDRFFNKLGFDKEDNFTGVKVEKCIVNKDKETWDLYLNAPNILPLKPLLKLMEIAKKGLDEVSEINIYLSYENKNPESIENYIKYYIDQLIHKSPSLISLKDNEIIINDNLIVFEVVSTIEADKIDEYGKHIIKFLEKFGINGYGTEVKINHAKRELIKEEIEKSNVDVLVKKEPEFKVIMGTPIKGKTITVKEIFGEEDNVILEAYIFDIEEFVSTKSNFKILTLKINDKTDSMIAKIFTKEDSDFATYKKGFKKGAWYKFRGYIKNDMYARDLVLNIRDAEEIPSKDIKRTDEAEVKRVELHAHTTMSQMDGVVTPTDLVNQAIKWGHKAIAITDKNGAQGYPEIYNTVKWHNIKFENEEDKFKVIYGTEMTLVDDTINVISKEIDMALDDATYCVYDVETTGFNAGAGDSIIEIGAVLIKNGEVLDTFSELINPGRPLPAKIIEITNITDEMLKDKGNEEEAVRKFIDWYKDAILVAHNAKFDMSFLEMAAQKYNLGEITNPVIDTLELSRALDPDQFRHSLSALVKRYEIPFDENAHHRADYDAEATGGVFTKMLIKVKNHHITNLKDLNNLVSKDEIHKFGRMYHVNILVKNKIGLKNLFKIISLANTKYLFKTPRILRSEIEKHREGLLIGSGCYESEVFVSARSKTEEELANVIKFYDYVEIQPLEVYDHLIQQGDFGNMLELENNIKKIINTTIDSDKLIVATGDVHHLDKEDKIYREIIINQNVPGGGRHPLNRKNIHSIPSTHFRTTDEMLSDFSYLGEELTNLMVLENPNKIADMIEHIDVIHQTNGVPFSPKIKDSDKEVKRIVYEKAHEVYGENLPKLIEDRIESELVGIIKGGYDVIYLISQKLVKKSNDDGYLVGSRGSVGSSFVATMLGITEVNPLPAHYNCPECKYTTFLDDEGVSLGLTYTSGYDLPDKKCPNCNIIMGCDGHDMPFATFLGFNADKVPDIDLNFSGDYQWKAHEYTKELFGVDNVYKAGTIGTVAEKTAYGYVKGYCEDKGITYRDVEIQRLVTGCVGVKRTTGQHPGGIIVIPDYMDVFDFTPYQYPSDNAESLWRTTHFDYGPMEDEILKLDILGHDVPTMHKMLEDLTGVDVTKIPLNDKKVLSLLSSTEALGVTPEDINCPTGTLGIPELGTRFVINLLLETQPKTFADAVKISGLSHGTDVWAGNASELIKNNIVPFSEVIGCRDDIMVYLMNNGVKALTAFQIMEFVRKGKPHKEPDKWKEYEATLKEAGIANWYIESCHKIKYMFPKAHAVAYVMGALRIAYFKVYHPLEYYSTYFTIKCTAFEVDTLLKGEQGIRNRMTELENKGYEQTNKEAEILDVLQNALEMVARGFSFKNIDLEKSEAKTFLITEDKQSLLIPFSALDGLGDNAAKQVIKERSLGRYLSVEDVQNRGKINSTTIDKMRSLGVFTNLPESSQLSFFD